MQHERCRWARLFDVPMKEETPPGFPANTLPVNFEAYHNTTSTG